MSGDPRSDESPEADTRAQDGQVHADPGTSEHAQAREDASADEGDEDAQRLGDGEAPADGDAGPEVHGDDAPAPAWSVVAADWHGEAASEDAISMPVAPPPPAPRRPVTPGEGVRWVVLAQIALAFVGAIPWWALLYSTRDYSGLEVAWLVAAAVGVGLAWQGHSRMLRWQVAFGCVTAAVPLLLQMRGADLLLAWGVATFYGAVAGFLVVAMLLGALTLREIVAVA